MNKNLENKRSIKSKSRYLLALIVVAVFTLSFTACTNQSTESASSKIDKTISQSSAISSISERSTPSSKVSSAESEISKDVSSSTPNNSQPEIDLLPQTDEGSEQFKEAFRNNPIDQKYNNSYMEATTVSKMIEISKTAAEEWKQMMDISYNSIMDSASQEDIAAVKTSQTTWLDELDSKIQEINEKEDNGDSSGALEISTSIMLLYRERATELCNIKFALDGSMPPFDEVNIDRAVG